MAPFDSPTIKSAFVCKSEYNTSKDQPNGTCSIRTEFILRNIFSHIIKPVGCFQPISAMTDKERYLLPILFEIIDDFMKRYQASIKHILSCLEIKLELNTLTCSLLDIFNELFSEGITWSQIVAFFAYVGEFTAQCMNKMKDLNVIDVIFVYVVRLVREHLECWIDDHGGWEGILTLSSSHKSRNEKNEDTAPKASVKVWARSFLYGSVRMIGTFAHIANAAQAYP